MKPFSATFFFSLCLLYFTLLCTKTTFATPHSPDCNQAMNDLFMAFTPDPKKTPIIETFGLVSLELPRDILGPTQGTSESATPIQEDLLKNISSEELHQLEKVLDARFITPIEKTIIDLIPIFSKLDSNNFFISSMIDTFKDSLMIFFTLYADEQSFRDYQSKKSRNDTLDTKTLESINSLKAMHEGNPLVKTLLKSIHLNAGLLLNSIGAILELDPQLEKLLIDAGFYYKKVLSFYLNKHESPYNYTYNLFKEIQKLSEVVTQYEQELTPYYRQYLLLYMTFEKIRMERRFDPEIQAFEKTNPKEKIDENAHPLSYVEEIIKIWNSPSIKVEDKAFTNEDIAYIEKILDSKNTISDIDKLRSLTAFFLEKHKEISLNIYSDTLSKFLKSTAIFILKDTRSSPLP